MSISVTWYGHSCFLVEAEGYRIVLDPYRDKTVPGLPNLRLQAHTVLCSHLHGDHCAEETVSILPNKPSPFQIERFYCFHDEKRGALRGENTVFRLQCQGLSVLHMGDLGHMLTDEQVHALFSPDLLLIPVGGYYTIDSEMAFALVQKLQPRVVIPMHYRSRTFGYREIAEVKPFLSRFAKVNTIANPFVLEQDTPSQTAVFSSYSVT